MSVNCLVTIEERTKESRFLGPENGNSCSQLDTHPSHLLSEPTIRQGFFKVKASVVKTSRLALEYRMVMKFKFSAYRSFESCRLCCLFFQTSDNIFSETVPLGFCKPKPSQSPALFSLHSTQSITRLDTKSRPNTLLAQIRPSNPQSGQQPEETWTENFIYFLCAS